MKKEKGQVSIETLLLASIIIMMSISVLGYYTRIMSPTMALEIIEVETLKQLDATNYQYFIEEIGYKAETSCAGGTEVICFCIMLDPVDNILDTDAIEEIVENTTGYEPDTVSIVQNNSANCS